MSNVCSNHKENPIKIYDQCVACEIETMRENAKEREEHIQKLTNELFDTREKFSRQNFDFYNEVRISMDEKDSLFREIARLRGELEKYIKRTKILMDGYDKIIESEGLPVTIAAEYVAEAMKVRSSK